MLPNNPDTCLKTTGLVYLFGLFLYMSSLYSVAESVPKHALPMSPNAVGDPQLEKFLPAPKPSVPPQQTLLQGGVSLQEAMAHETQVDWYAWYLSVREKIAQQGGFRCNNPNYPVELHANGWITTQDPDLDCLWSVRRIRGLPFPGNTKFTLIKLPLRSSSQPPMPKAEFLNRLSPRNNR